MLTDLELMFLLLKAVFCKCVITFIVSSIENGSALIKWLSVEVLLTRLHSIYTFSVYWLCSMHSNFDITSPLEYSTVYSSLLWWKLSWFHGISQSYSMAVRCLETTYWETLTNVFWNLIRSCSDHYFARKCWGKGELSR